MLSCLQVYFEAETLNWRWHEVDIKLKEKTFAIRSKNVQKSISRRKELFLSNRLFYVDRNNAIHTLIVLNSFIPNFISVGHHVYIFCRPPNKSFSAFHKGSQWQSVKENQNKVDVTKREKCEVFTNVYYLVINLCAGYKAPWFPRKFLNLFLCLQRLIHSKS